MRCSEQRVERNTVTKRVHLGFKPVVVAVDAGALWVPVGHGALVPLG
jgi:hypothetical protein